MNNKYYEAWFKLLNGKSGAKDTSEIIGINEKTLELYSGFVKNHHKNALKKMFPRLRAIRELDWENISEEYYKRVPPKSWDLNQLSYSFKVFAHDFLFEDDSQKEALLELIEYEINEFLCYRSDYDIKISHEFYQINPHHKISQFEYDVALWVFEMDKDSKKASEVKPLKNKNILFYTRDLETHLCKFTKVSAFEIGIYEIISQVKVHKENIAILEYHLHEMLGEQLGSFKNQDVKEKTSFLLAQSVIF